MKYTDEQRIEKMTITTEKLLNYLDSLQQKNRHRTIGIFHDGHLRLAEDRGRRRRERAFCS